MPGVKLDFRRFENGHIATAADVGTGLARIRRRNEPLDIVVVNTAAGAACGSDRHVDTGCGISCAATTYLLARGDGRTGADAWWWDVPFDDNATRFADEKAPLTSSSPPGWGEESGGSRSGNTISSPRA